MEVKSVPTLGWTRGNVAATILLVTQEERDHIARRVRELMTEHGYTNAALAYKAGVAEKTISRVINAKREARYDTLERIASVFGLAERDLRPRDAPLGLPAVGPPAPLGQALAELQRELGEVHRKLDALTARLGDPGDGSVIDVITQMLEQAAEQQQAAQSKRQRQSAREPRAQAAGPRRAA